MNNNEYNSNNQTFNYNTNNKNKSPTNINNQNSLVHNPYNKANWSNQSEGIGNSNYKKANLKNRDLPKDNNRFKNNLSNATNNTYNNTILNINNNNNNSNGNCNSRRNPVLNNLINSNNGINTNNINGENKNYIITANVSDKLNSLHQSARCLIVAKAFEMQENKEPAIRFFVEALKYDPGNIEAYEALINHNLFSNDQKAKLMEDLIFDKNNLWLYDYFHSKSEDKIFITEKSECLNSLNLDNIFDANNKNLENDESKFTKFKKNFF